MKHHWHQLQRLANPKSFIIYLNKDFIRKLKLIQVIVPVPGLYTIRPPVVSQYKIRVSSIKLNLLNKQDTQKSTCTVSALNDGPIKTALCTSLEEGIWGTCQLNNYKNTSLTTYTNNSNLQIPLMLLKYREVNVNNSFFQVL